MYCDTLYYDMARSFAEMAGATQLLLSDTAQVYAQGGGIAENEVQQFTFYESVLETPSYKVWGDTLFFDQLQGHYRGRGHLMIEIGDSLRLFAKQGYYDTSKGEIWLQGEAVARRILPKDTIYLRSDTLHMQEEDGKTVQHILAYPRAQVYGSDMSARCDSMVYLAADSLILLREEPIIWLENNQTTADSVNIYMPHFRLKRADFWGNALTVSQDSLKLFNQLRGRSMHMHFANDSLRYIDVKGNAESIYHVLEGDTALLGMNRVVSGEVRMFFQGNGLEDVLFLQSPSGTFFRPLDITSANSRLRGFSWQDSLRPDREKLLWYLQNYLQRATDRQPQAPPKHKNVPQLRHFVPFEP